MSISMRNPSLRTHLQSLCALPAKQGASFSTDNLHQQEVTLHFPRKALLRWGYCQQDAAPLISAIPFLLPELFPVIGGSLSITTSHVQQEHNSLVKPDLGKLQIQTRQCSEGHQLIHLSAADYFWCEMLAPIPSTKQARVYLVWRTALQALPERVTPEPALTPVPVFQSWKRCCNHTVVQTPVLVAHNFIYN